jgi:AcrR family transcriptional regulator
MATNDDSRQRLLATARDLFRDKSYHRTTLREIATNAHVTTGALYHHFTSKDELFVEVCVEGMRNLLRRLDTAARLTEGRPPAEQVVALFDAYIAFYIEERGYYELIERLERGSEQLNILPELAGRVESMSKQIFNEMVAILRRTEPVFDEQEAKKRVLFATALTEGLVSCDRRGLLARAGLSLASFRSMIISLAGQIVPTR